MKKTRLLGILLVLFLFGCGSPAPSFTLSLSPATLQVQQGSSGTAQLTLTPQNGFTGAVVLSLKNPPAGISLSPGGLNVSGTNPVVQTLTLSVAASLPADTYTLTLEAGSGTLVKSVNLSLTVTQLLPPAAPTLSLAFGLKRFDFSWSAVAGASLYKLLEDPDGSGPLPFAQVGSDLSGTSTSLYVSLVQKLNAQYKLQACNSGGCTDSNPVGVAANLIQAIGYFKASNTGADDYFGYAVALSGDGNTLAVGADGEASNATGIGGNQNDNSAVNSGAVYLFRRAGTVWSQQAYVKASNTGAGDFFGASVALSGDGNTLAVGAYLEDSNATGIGGNQNDNSAAQSGAVYVFTRTGTVWSQQAYVKASNTGAGDQFGHSVALSGDGNTLAVGAIREDSNATGIGGNQNDNSALESGAVYLY